MKEFQRGAVPVQPLHSFCNLEPKADTFEGNHGKVQKRLHDKAVQIIDQFKTALTLYPTMTTTTNNNNIPLQREQLYVLYLPTDRN